ncbi:MAG: Integrase domain protein, partial [Candidatus Uhrbacteria bacterium GW2011_GWA2_53_10]
PDSGSEFINWHCLEWSEERTQKLTRSRPNHKNDNCFVEERNGHVVRRWVGYARFDAPEVVDALNAVYDVLTPYQRVLARTDVTDEVKAELRRVHESLNPLILKREIDRRLKQVFDIQKRHSVPTSRSIVQ